MDDNNVLQYTVMQTRISKVMSPFEKNIDAYLLSISVNISNLY